MERTCTVNIHPRNSSPKLFPTSGAHHDTPTASQVIPPTNPRTPTAHQNDPFHPQTDPPRPTTIPTRPPKRTKQTNPPPDKRHQPRTCGCRESRIARREADGRSRYGARAGTDLKGTGSVADLNMPAVAVDDDGVRDAGHGVIARPGTHGHRHIPRHSHLESGAPAKDQTGAVDAELQRVTRERPRRVARLGCGPAKPPLDLDAGAATGHQPESAVAANNKMTRRVLRKPKTCRP
jgi:hypothetical protein